jgi:hypothetical protein
VIRDATVAAWIERDLSGIDMVALMVDSMHVDNHVLPMLPNSRELSAEPPPTLNS